MGSRESTETRTPSSSNEEDAIRPPPPQMTSRRRTAEPRRQPSGFRMAGNARELHGSNLYCVTWSTDVFQDEQRVHADDPPREMRVLATCGGNNVTLYEAEIPHADTKRSSLEALTVRQAYVDPDEDEFFSCAFGGRCLGHSFGYKPVHENSDTPIVLGAKTTSNVGSRTVGGKRSHENMDSGSNDDADDETQQQAMGNMQSFDIENETRQQLFQAVGHMQSFDGPQLLCVAGTRGVIKVIDTVRQMLFTTLCGHGSDIYDLKFCPADEWLLLSASKDESVRLWNVKTATCVAVFAGHEGHRDAVLTVNWHRLGDRFVSAGMDTTIKLWEIGEGTVVNRAVQASNTVKVRTRESNSNSLPATTAFGTVFDQMPYFSTNKVHLDYVDCVQFVGDLVLSKSIANIVVLWKPELTRTLRPGVNKAVHQRLPNEVVPLREFPISKCNVWFIRFQTDSDCRMLAVGNTVGEIKIWEIDDNPKKKSFANLEHQYCTSAVRMVAFSPDAKCLVAACDDSTLWRWDAQYNGK